MYISTARRTVTIRTVPANEWTLELPRSDLIFSDDSSQRLSLYIDAVRTHRVPEGAIEKLRLLKFPVFAYTFTIVIRPEKLEIPESYRVNKICNSMSPSRCYLSDISNIVYLLTRAKPQSTFANVVPNMKSLYSKERERQIKTDCGVSNAAANQKRQIVPEIIFSWSFNLFFNYVFKYMYFSLKDYYK